jgi:hypothetical protein
VRLPKNLDVLEKSVKINLLEQESFIADLENYDKENA